jgi:hypothetical protein
MSADKRFTETIEQHFPITVMQRQLHDIGPLNDKLFDWLKGMAAQHGAGGANAANDPAISTRGGYQTSKQTNIFELKRPEIGRLRDRYILPAVHRYLKSVYGGQSGDLNPHVIGWANLLRSGDWQSPHMHPSEANLASGVYYMRMPELVPPAGCIEFINPHPISVHHGFLTTRRIEPEEGLLLLFPPFYLHYVHPFQSDAERGIIAFDVLARRDKLSFTL